MAHDTRTTSGGGGSGGGGAPTQLVAPPPLPIVGTIIFSDAACDEMRAYDAALRKANAEHVWSGKGVREGLSFAGELARDMTRFL